MKPKHMATTQAKKAALPVPTHDEKLETTLSDRQEREKLAATSAQARQFADAIRIYTSLLQDFPDDPRILVNLGFCYFQTGQNKQAFDTYVKVIRMAEVRAIETDVLSLAWTNLAAFYEHFTYYELAYERYQLAIQVDPNNQLAKQYLDELETLANSGNAPSGTRILPNGTEVPAPWDGSFIKQYHSGKIER
jgi:tetratricopeptide (TPR) repeat protein